MGTKRIKPRGQASQRNQPRTLGQSLWQQTIHRQGSTGSVQRGPQGVRVPQVLQTKDCPQLPN